MDVLIILIRPKVVQKKIIRPLLQNNLQHIIFDIMKKIAEKLIQLNSKSWLAEKLGITRPTLDNRLAKENWKKGEVAILLQLNRSILVA
jgi:DNA invertase Pin-like site-specific DNA recombinase